VVFVDVEVGEEEGVLTTEGTDDTDGERELVTEAIRSRLGSYV
jgi:hypothetical protein